MKKFRGNHLTSVTCNCCGKKLVVEREIIKEGAIHIGVEWGYFSEKDGEIHSFDLCEECYDDIISRFALPVKIIHATEMI